jgi:DNA-binding SARP family transcriptional activator/ABC-type branched-subunit amino acid transport system substrate-binding protein/DNA-binding beta-propeller fold protein YncE
MDYRILGPLELVDGSAALPLSGGRQRALLALLLIHRNEAVPSEQLIDALWGERPPPSAPKALQNAVLQIRRALGDEAGALRTEHGGYVLSVAHGELDADRFEALAAAGRAALDDGKPAEGADKLREALALWRGAPFADLGYEAFAQPEIARLEEQRLAALEDRFDADLALGRHDALIGELEAAVARHPLRERLRAQLMTALYRAGRQADALAAFHDARRALVDELGIEPGPALRETHEAILRQDPALDPPARAVATPAGTAPRSRRALLAVAAALLVVAAALAVIATRDGDEQPQAARIADVPGNSLVAIDPRTASVTGVYPAGSTPTEVAAGAGGTWALNADDATLTRVAGPRSSPRTFSAPPTTLGIDAGPSGVWALAGKQLRFGPIVPRSVVRLSPDNATVTSELTLPAGVDSQWFTLNRISVGRSGVWVLGAGDRVYRIDPAGVGATPVKGVRASGIVADGDGAWALSETPKGFEVVRLSTTLRRKAGVPIAATHLDGLAAGAGAVWATAPQDGLLWRIESGATRSIDVGAGARGVAVAGGAVWVANAARGTVTKVDPVTNRVEQVIRIGNAPRALAYDGERLWLTLAAGGGGAAARDAGRAATGAVTAPACGEVVAGSAKPDRLIVSDLPLHQRGISRFPDAIAYILRKHDFRAGRFDVGYQSCDDSTAQQGGWEPIKCRSNAELYARTPRVIGIIGAYNSDCTAEQLAITNRAGPLATISPANTSLMLTKPVPGGDEELPEAFYPTGRRHYARLVGADDAQSAALVRFAHDRGVRRLTIVEGEGDGWYGRALAAHAQRAARELGIDVIATHMHPDSPARARALGAKIAATRPDALYYAAVPYFGPPGKQLPAFALVEELRRQLGSDVLILGPDAWIEGPAVFAELGDDARGIHASYQGVPVQRLGPAGQRFVEEFGATQPGGLVDKDAVYAAHAAEVLLEAIARSDGSRASVTEELLATDIEDGLTGDVSFDADGDVRPRPMQIVRLSPNVVGLEPDAGNLAALISP